MAEKLFRVSLAVTLVVAACGCSDDNETGPTCPDPDIPRVWLPEPLIVVDEGCGWAAIPVMRSHGDIPWYISLDVSPGTATADDHAESNRVWSPMSWSDSTQFVLVRIINDDIYEQTESFYLEITERDTSYCIVEPSWTEVRIVEDDFIGTPAPITMPLDLGHEWQYQVLHFARYPTYWDETLDIRKLLVSDLVNFKDTTYSVLTADPGTHWSLRRGFLLRQEGQTVDGAAVADTTLRTSDSVWVAKHDGLPWRFVDFDLQPGDSWTPFEFEGPTNDGPFNVSHMFQYFGRVVVATPAGVFEDVAHFRYKRDWQGPGGYYLRQEESYVHFYIADQIGIVRLAHGGTWYSPDTGTDLYYWNLLER